MKLYYEYLGPTILAGFDTYKYSSKDTSPLSQYVMHPFWDQVSHIYTQISHIYNTISLLNNLKTLLLC